MATTNTRATCATATHALHATATCATCALHATCTTCATATCPSVGTAIDPATLLGWAYRVATHPSVYTDPALLACAEGRIARFEAGTYLQADVQGLLDWADAEGWR